MQCSGQIFGAGKALAEQTVHRAIQHEATVAEKVLLQIIARLATPSALEYKLIANSQ